MYEVFLSFSKPISGVRTVDKIQNQSSDLHCYESNQVWWRKQEILAPYSTTSFKYLLFKVTAIVNYYLFYSLFLLYFTLISYCTNWRS